MGFSNLKIFGNSPPVASNFKSFSQSLQQLFSHCRPEQFLKQNTIPNSKPWLRNQSNCFYFFSFPGLDTSKEHEYVLLEEVVSPGSSNINNNSPLMPTGPKQRMVGMQEMPLQVRNKWKHETKFVLKRVGQDPSWRARLGNLMSFNEDQEHSSAGE